ncbi:MAG: GxxExxY protein [Desulfobacterales bacterium]|nr:MAG: GxxExxY protein [Desulfobacterales bacterium]
MNRDELTWKIISAAIEVHHNLGPGLLKSVYEECLCYELKQGSIAFERKKRLPIAYKGIQIDCGYHMDIVALDEIIVEVKACEVLQQIHAARLLTYLKLAGIKTGLLINFDVVVLKDGIRIVNI